MDMLAGHDGLAHAGWAIAGRRAVHVNLVWPGQRVDQIGRPAQPSVSCPEGSQPVAISADEQQVGHQPIAIA
jgi:hypothetical protein